MSFVEPIIYSTMNTIIGVSDDNSECSSINSSESEHDISLDPNACCNQFKEYEKFNFFCKLQR